MYTPDKLIFVAHVHGATKRSAIPSVRPFVRQQFTLTLKIVARTFKPCISFLLNMLGLSTHLDSVALSYIFHGTVTMVQASCSYLKWIKSL